jgi:hypothetical protein
MLLEGLIYLILLTTFPGLSKAQFPPLPQDIQVVSSKFHDGVTLSYKQVRDWEWDIWAMMLMEEIECNL